MKITPHGSNQTLVEMKGYEILVSYSTPVAIRNRAGRCTYATTEKFSATTSKHVPKFIIGERIGMDSGLFKEMLKEIGYED